MDAQSATPAPRPRRATVKTEASSEKQNLNVKNEDIDSDFEAQDADEDNDDEPAYTPKSTAKSTPKSAPKRKTPAKAATTPSKKAKVSKTKPKPAAPPPPVHKAEPMLEILQRALEKGVKNGEVTLDQNKLACILQYVGVLRRGCDEVGITNKIFGIPEPTGEGEAVGRAVAVLSEGQVLQKARALAGEIVYDMSKKMKWTGSCRTGNARVNTEGLSLDGPEVFLKLLQLDEGALKKACNSFEYTSEEFEERFGDTPSGEVRYASLWMTGLIKVRWWPKTGQYKVWGTYGKPK
ncbi:hypothetical protein BJ508DRAFT_323792 [Ascobolus immersus RN42]|uniref:Uncharacterized protein n=1 Tax=Ascobolus immersus RN42 TaxID=1160509 RepID=A0A3N4IFB6_ASCIM|nr:hypothetical protein BJ508DRAFT_323792 [Ascobolus immersus RN42]